MNRVTIVTMLGVAIAAGSDLVPWNGFRHPDDHALANATDRVAGTCLMGIVIATVVKKRKREKG